MCRTRPGSTKPQYVVHNLDEESSDEDSTSMYVHTVNKDKQKDDDEWRATVRLNDKPVSLKLDTGADCNVITKDLYDSICTRPPHKT